MTPHAWPSISIIGLGHTGSRAARRLLTAGPALALTVFDTEPDRCEPFHGDATLALSAREALQESDTILLALPDLREIDRTLERFSDGRVGVNLRGKVVGNLKPALADPARQLGHAIAAAGGVYIPAAGASAVLRRLAETMAPASARVLLAAMDATGAG